MGGCRCTYRNCTVKSDGKTHMFHYPVFEKVRCHQWLLNGHRLDFLNLKVSQLKNRVVCQHHFKDDNFMNFKKDKLTFDAIPTEDGPFCDSTKYVNLNPDSSKIFSVIIDDTENDYITANGKKANCSIKYGDFLANLDLMDIEKIDDDNIDYKNLNNSVDIFSPYNSRGKAKLYNEEGSFPFNISLPDKSDNKCTHPTLAVSPYKSSTDTINEVLNYGQSKSNNNNTSTNKHIILDNTFRNVKPMQSHPPYQQHQVPQKKESSIKIISEKQVTNLAPMLPIHGKFTPVPPNFVLDVSKIKRKVISDNTTSLALENKDIFKDKKDNIEIDIEPATKVENNAKVARPKVAFVLDVSKMKRKVILENTNNIPTENKETFKDKKDNIEIDIEPVIKEEDNLKVAKPKVAPERVKAINKKRLFNMKLRDMVESCLDKLENNDKNDEQVEPLKNTKTKLNKRRVQQVRSLPKNICTLSTQDQTITYLEERIKDMEKTLLEKIDQNSQKITELKNTFVKTSENKQVTQSKVDEHTHKKQLFQEIAQYLSPDSKSLIYEELFINKFALNEPISLPKQKRQRYK